MWNNLFFLTRSTSKFFFLRCTFGPQGNIYVLKYPVMGYGQLNIREAPAANHCNCTNIQFKMVGTTIIILCRRISWRELVIPYAVTPPTITSTTPITAFHHLHLHHWRHHHHFIPLLFHGKKTPLSSYLPFDQASWFAVGHRLSSLLGLCSLLFVSQTSGVSYFDP